MIRRTILLKAAIPRVVKVVGLWGKSGLVFVGESCSIVVVLCCGLEALTFLD
jgi:hypothetical protein